MSIDLISYVLESGKWIQSDKLYPHDIALILDPSMKTIYLWEGYRATAAKKKNAAPFVLEIQEKYPSFKFEKLGETIPLKVQGYIEENLDRSFEEIKKIDRDPFFKAFLICSYLCFAVLFFTYLKILGIWRWNQIPGGIFEVSIDDYSIWISDSLLMLIISSVFFEILFIISIFTKKSFLILTAVIGIIIELSTYRYMLLNEYLFDFRAIDDGLATYYYIFTSEGVMFTFLNLLALCAMIIPMIISIKAIYSQTIPITFKEWQEKRQRAIQVELVKVSAYLEASTSTPIPDPRKK